MSKGGDGGEGDDGLGRGNGRERSKGGEGPQRHWRISPSSYRRRPRASSPFETGLHDKYACPSLQARSPLPRGQGEFSLWFNEGSTPCSRGGGHPSSRRDRARAHTHTLYLSTTRTGSMILHFNITQASSPLTASCPPCRAWPRTQPGASAHRGRQRAMATQQTAVGDETTHMVPLGGLELSLGLGLARLEQLLFRVKGR